MGSNKLLFGLGTLVVIGLLAALFYSLSGDGDDGTVVSRGERTTHEIKYASGTPKETREVIQGPKGRPLVHGLRTLYWENGKKKMEMTFVEGKQVGNGTFWYEDGQRSIEGEFQDSQRHGKVTSWHSNGKKASEGDYRNGKPHGLLVKWSDAGDLVEEGNYINGVRHGEFVIYDLDGGKESIRYDSGRVMRE